MGSLTVGGWVTGHSSIMINNMDLVFSQPRGGGEYNGLQKKRLELVHVHLLRETHGEG